jgi:hypothetical protein
VVRRGERGLVVRRRDKRQRKHGFARIRVGRDVSGDGDCRRRARQRERAFGERPDRRPAGRDAARVHDQAVDQAETRATRSSRHGLLGCLRGCDRAGDGPGEQAGRSQRKTVRGAEKKPAQIGQTLQTQRDRPAACEALQRQRGRSLHDRYDAAQSGALPDRGRRDGPRRQPLKDDRLAADRDATRPLSGCPAACLSAPSPASCVGRQRWSWAPLDWSCAHVSAHPLERCPPRRALHPVSPTSESPVRAGLSCVGVLRTTSGCSGRYQSRYQRTVNAGRRRHQRHWQWLFSVIAARSGPGWAARPFGRRVLRMHALTSRRGGISPEAFIRDALRRHVLSGPGRVASTIDEFWVPRYGCHR